MTDDDFQFWLETFGATLITGDFENFAKGVELPLVVITYQTTTVISDTASLKSGFFSFHQMLKSMKITDAVRIGSELRQLSESMVTALFQTHILNGSVHVVPAWTSQLTLRRTDDQWRAVCVSNGVSDIRWPFTVTGENLPEDS